MLTLLGQTTPRRHYDSGTTEHACVLSDLHKPSQERMTCRALRLCVETCTVRDPVPGLWK